MIPLTFLYDEYIDRPKLTEQKNPFEYIVPPPTSRVGTKKNLNKTFFKLKTIRQLVRKIGLLNPPFFLFLWNGLSISN